MNTDVFEGSETVEQPYPPGTTFQLSPDYVSEDGTMIAPGDRAMIGETVEHVNLRGTREPPPPIERPSQAAHDSFCGSETVETIADGFTDLGDGWYQKGSIVRARPRKPDHLEP